MMEFSKVLSNNYSNSKLSEKEEESHTTTQETILQKPNDFLDTSNSFSRKDSSKETVNITTLSNNNDFYYNNNLMNSTDNFNRNSVLISQNKSNFSEMNNDLRKSIQSTTSFQSQSYKMYSNPFLVLKSHLDSVREIYLTPDKKSLISVGEDMLINFWDFKKALKQGKENVEPYLLSELT